MDKNYGIGSVALINGREFTKINPDMWINSEMSFLREKDIFNEKLGYTFEQKSEGVFIPTKFNSTLNYLGSGDFKNENGDIISLDRNQIGGKIFINGQKATLSQLHELKGPWEEIVEPQLGFDPDSL